MRERQRPGQRRQPRAAASGSGKVLAAKNNLPPAHVKLRQNPRYRHVINHLHRLGPQPVGELLLELAHNRNCEAELMPSLELHCEFDAIAIARLGGRYWPPLPLSEVA